MKKLLVVVMFSTIACARQSPSQTPATHWVGTALVHGQQVPVRLDLSAAAKDGHISGSLINAGEFSVSSSGELSGTHLVLHFDYFETHAGFSGPATEAAYTQLKDETRGLLERLLQDQRSANLADSNCP